MKRLLIVAALALSTLAGSTNADAQGCTPSTTYYKYRGPSPMWYGKSDSVSNTGTDTFKVAISCSPKSITFQNNHLKITGTPAGTVTLYGSIDNVGYDSLTSYTVNVSSTTTPQAKTFTVDNQGACGNPYTNYMWVWNGSGTMLASWIGKVLIR